MALGDFAVGVTIGASLQGSFLSAVGSSVKHFDRLGKSVDDLRRRAARTKAVRELGSEIGATSSALRAASSRAAILGREMRGVEKPSRKMGTALAGARREAAELTERLGRQRAALRRQRRELRRAGDAVSDLARRERDLSAALAEQTRRRDRLGRALSRGARAREDRGARRGQLVDAAALGAAVALPLKAAVGSAIEFESAMADVRKVVNFETPAQFQAMERDIIGLSRRLPVAVGGIADIVAAAGQAGIARRELSRFAEDAAKIAVAFDIEGKQAGGAVTGLRSIFGLDQDAVMRSRRPLRRVSRSR